MSSLGDLRNGLIRGLWTEMLAQRAEAASRAAVASDKETVIWNVCCGQREGGFRAASLRISFTSLKESAMFQIHPSDPRSPD